MKQTTIEALANAPTKIAGPLYKHVLNYQTGKWHTVPCRETIEEYEATMHGIPALHKDDIEAWLEQRHWVDI